MNIENRVQRVSSHHPIQRFLYLFIFSICAVGVALYVWETNIFGAYISQIEWLKIEKVDIQAQWPITEEKIRGLLPGLEGESLLGIQASTLAEKIEQNSWVASVTVSKHFPRELSISVESKKPKAIYLIEGRPVYVDSKGEVIDKVNTEVAKKFELPVISMMQQSTLVKWELGEAIQLLDKLVKYLSSQFLLSELFLEAYPYFRVYFGSPKVEVLFSYENWEAQIHQLIAILNNPRVK